jgi:type IV pilus biogenesis protein CpaD/CtpE
MILPLTRFTLPVLLVLAAAALAGCETTGVGAKPEAAKPVEPPMTHTRAAEQCWMATEKGNAGLPLDKRADVVDKCIEQKMKAAASAPAG